MRLEAQLTLAQRTEFRLVRLAELRPPPPTRAVEVEPPVLPAPSSPQTLPAEPDAAAAGPRIGTGEIRLSTQLRIELDQLANRFVIRQFEPPDPEPVFQFPSEAQLSLSRTLNALLRASREAAFELTA